jgi:hypothetical protein
VASPKRPDPSQIPIPSWTRPGCRTTGGAPRP